MMRSFSSAVSGLKNQQTKMDVIGNNISNSSTVGFKSSRVSFKESFAQMVRSGNRPINGVGGTNPAQVGIGSLISTIQTRFEQGNLESTGQTTDLAITGDAMFVVSNGAERLYTRAGNFQLDANGSIVHPANGYILLGRMATGGILGGPITPLQIPLGQKVPPQATGEVTLRGNLDQSQPIGAASQAETSLVVYDSLGVEHTLRIVTEKTGVGAWSWTAYFDGGAVPVATGPMTFDATGQLTAPLPGAYPVLNIPAATVGGGATDMNVTLNVGAGYDGITQLAGQNGPVLRDQDGYQSGVLTSFAIDRSGIITGSFSNGTTLTLAQIAVADFNNPAGLERMGDSMYAESPNSGGPVLDYPLSGSASSLTAGALEQSNVDLAQEFTDMIQAQRSYSANGRVISTASEMLQELVNLGR